MCVNISGKYGSKIELITINSNLYKHVINSQGSSKGLEYYQKSKNHIQTGALMFKAQLERQH